MKSNIYQIFCSGNKKARNNAGFSLVELMVAVGVLLILGGLVYASSPAFKEGGYRADCINNIESAQKAMRQWSDQMELDAGDAIDDADFINAAAAADPQYLIPVVQECRAPNGTGYTYAATVPNIGVVFSTCTVNDGGVGSRNHTPSAKMTRGW